MTRGPGFPTPSQGIPTFTPRHKKSSQRGMRVRWEGRLAKPCLRLVASGPHSDHPRASPEASFSDESPLSRLRAWQLETFQASSHCGVSPVS